MRANSNKSRKGPGANSQCGEDNRGSQASGCCPVEEAGSKEIWGVVQEETKREKRARWTKESDEEEDEEETYEVETGEEEME